MPNYLVIEEKHITYSKKYGYSMFWIDTEIKTYYVVLVSLKVYTQVNSPCVDWILLIIVFVFLCCR